MPSSTTATSGLLPQLEQRQRQADVVVEIPLVPEHPVPRRQELRRHFLRRGLAGAAGDRHDACSRRAGARRAPRACSATVVSLRADQHRRVRRATAADARRRHACRPARPPRRAPSASATNGGRRTARRESRRRSRPRASVRESIETRADRAGRDCPAGARPPVAAATSPAVSVTRVHALTTPARPARAAAQRASWPRPRRRTAAPGRRSPASSRAPCRRSAPGRRAARRGSPSRSPPCDRRSRGTASTRAAAGPCGARSAGMTMPRLISSMIRAGSSERGLSDVTITRSLRRAATAPISGRLVRSRSPPQPKTVMTRPRASGRAVSSRFFSASSVCA